MAQKLKKHTVNPSLKSLQTKQELVRRDIADAARSVAALDAEIADQVRLKRRTELMPNHVFLYIIASFSDIT